MKNVSKLLVASAAVLAIPGVAHAGTATDAKTATFKVINQCSITGANINVGTFTTTNTWGDVFAVHGHIRESDRADVRGTLGLTGVNWGSVTCDAGTPYNLQIKGKDTDWNYALLLFNVNGKRMSAWPMVKKIGAIDVPDSYWVDPDIGGSAHDWVAGVGTGAPQAVIGHMWFDPGWGGFAPDRAVTADQLGASGTYIANIDYTLNF